MSCPLNKIELHDITIETELESVSKRAMCTNNPRYCNATSTKLRIHKKTQLLNEICAHRKPLSFNRLYFSSVYTTNHSIQDKLFGMKNVQWILANKLIIASNYRMEITRIMGANTNSISHENNIHFFVDAQQNLCAVLSLKNDEYKQLQINNDNDNDNDILEDHSFCYNLTQHCKQLDLALVTRYPGLDKQCESKMQRTLGWKPLHANIVVIRIPLSYYTANMKHSFYEFCCKLGNYIVSNHYYSHPLFSLFMTSIAHFDCFQMCLPLVPLSGTLEEMYSQFALGEYVADSEAIASALQDDDDDNYRTSDDDSDSSHLPNDFYEYNIYGGPDLAHRQLVAKKGPTNQVRDSFEACYKCWQLSELNRACSQCLYALSDQHNVTPDIMSIIIKYSAFNATKFGHIYLATNRNISFNSTKFNHYSNSNSNSMIAYY